MSDVRKLVKLKPLEWEDFPGRGAKTAAWLQAHYMIQKWSDGRYELSASYPGHCTDIDGTERFYLSLEAVKAAAQADYEARIYAAITPASDGRAEGLREAAEIAQSLMEQWATATYQNMDARMQNAAKTYAAGDIVSAILARAAEREGGSHE